MTLLNDIIPDHRPGRLLVTAAVAKYLHLYDPSIEVTKYSLWLLIEPSYSINSAKSNVLVIYTCGN